MAREAPKCEWVDARGAASRAAAAGRVASFSSSLPKQSHAETIVRPRRANAGPRRALRTRASGQRSAADDGTRPAAHMARETAK
eukprot:CAMPEP_0179986620 /NCGR_PEP_ID=MMETSP0984-20121128/2336_1 /TAXON_ID=483367 /ORGANISM="non described non described, Strain CCMP 2436" /LENGTH=83 /DNA_ID=CAMNT_0021905431 /DNA_START=1134 /DNA_END=1385 /DNA_ORIENTATION=-